MTGLSDRTVATGTTPATVRPLRPDDVVAAEALAWAALDGAGRRYGFDMGERDAGRVAFAQSRMRHILATDPDGCRVAERDGEVVGVALALRRGPLWFLSLLTVREDHQGTGVGRHLLDAALATARGSAAGMICASPDPKALRRYGRAGFAIHPGIEALGIPDRTELPEGLGVRDGDWERDRELVEALVTARRGAAYGVDLDWFRDQDMRLLVRDGGPGDRAAALMKGPRLGMLTGDTVEAAGRVLWAFLAESPDRVQIPYLHGGAQWAIGVALRARLSLTLADAVCTRGSLAVPPSPYVPSGMFG
jgi:predicted N-acetyltransferase YhbS